MKTGVKKIKKHTDTLQAASDLMRGLHDLPPLKSHEYQSLKNGLVEEFAVIGYINSTPGLSVRDLTELASGEGSRTTEQLLAAASHADEQLKAEQRRIRLNMVLSMNLATLEALALHYKIPESSKIPRVDPLFRDPEKGPVVIRLRQFYLWEAEYQGTDPEIQAIDVEAALADAALSRTNRELPSVADKLETVLLYVSNKQSTPINILYKSLRDRVTLQWVCKSSKHKIEQAIRNLDVLLEEHEVLLEEVNKEINEVNKEINGANEEANESPADNSMAIQHHKVLTERLRAFTERHEALTERRNEMVENLEKISEYQNGFKPGDSAPTILQEKAKSRFVAQFTPEQAVGSVACLAWLVSDFREFWEKHGRGYLALDPKHKDLQEGLSKHGSKGAHIKADRKWTNITYDFVTFLGNVNFSHFDCDAESLKNEAQKFGESLMKRQERGISDKRTVEPFVRFLSTLANHVYQKPSADLAGVIHRLLREDAAHQSNDGRKKIGRRTPYSLLSIDTVEACLAILRSAVTPGSSTPVKSSGSKSTPRKRTGNSP